MDGMSERQYAAHCGLSRTGVQRAKAAGHLVLYEDGSIDAEASDVKREASTDPSKSRTGRQEMKAVSAAAVAAVGATLQEQGVAGVEVQDGSTFLEAKIANEILKAQERRLRLQQMKGDLIDRTQATALVFQLAREERDGWVNWPARAAALMAAELGVDAATMQIALESHVRQHLDELAEVKPEFR